MEKEFWQFCIVFKKSLWSQFASFEKTLKTCEPEGVIKLDKNKLLVAINVLNAQKIQELIKSKIVDIIISIYKHEYFSKYISSLEKLGKLKHIFLKVLTMFDVEADTLEIEKNLRLENAIYIDEFYCFRLTTLQKKWKEICDMVEDNSYFFTSQNLVFELMRFLLSSAKTKRDFLTINVENDKLDLIDECNNTIFSQKINESNDNIIIKILDNYPKRIYLKHNENLDENTSNLFYLIFKNTLKPLYFV